MRAAGPGAAAGLRATPGWARLGSPSRIGTLAAVLVLFCVSGGMLWLVGYNYDGLAGSAATKIHPSTYMIVLVFCWSLIASGDPVSRGCLGAHEQHTPAARHDIADLPQGLLEERHGLGQVELDLLREASNASQITPPIAK